jgi:dihydrofolate synthase/folylpolyglutamate synthase
LPPAPRDPIRTLAQAAGWLEGLIDVEKRPDWPYRRFSLAPIRALLGRLDAPERGLSVLHVAGSKGKGSTALLAEALLSAGGFSTGTFTSPHLERWTERFRIDGQDVRGEQLASAVERVRPHVEALRSEDPERAPTFFDATTATALLLFRDAGVDHAVLEVGLGGRLDSTNACAPHVTCITSIELEHTDRLGDTLAAIAGEKAGILKPGVPAVVGDLPEEALSVVRDRAAAVGAPTAVLGRDFRLEASAAQGAEPCFRVVDGPLDVEFALPLLGPAAPTNAALALACVRRLVADATSAREMARWAREGLASVTLPGRLELVSREPTVIVDAAHTAASARALATVLDGLQRPVDLVLSISAGKDLPVLLETLLPRVRRATLTRAEPTRSLDPAEIARAARALAPDTELRVVPNPHLAVRAARDAVGSGEALCVTGSVYLAGIARGVLRDTDSSRRVEVTRGRRRDGG